MVRPTTVPTPVVDRLRPAAQRLAPRPKTNPTPGDIGMGAFGEKKKLGLKSPNPKSVVSPGTNGG